MATRRRSGVDAFMEDDDNREGTVTTASGTNVSENSNADAPENVSDRPQATTDDRLRDLETVVKSLVGEDNYTFAVRERDAREREENDDE